MIEVLGSADEILPKLAAHVSKLERKRRAQERANGAPLERQEEKVEELHDDNLLDGALGEEGTEENATSDGAKVEND